MGACISFILPLWIRPWPLATETIKRVWHISVTWHQGWKLKHKPKPENPVLKEILETQTDTDTYLAKILKT